MAKNLAVNPTHFGELIRQCSVGEVGTNKPKYEVRYLGYSSDALGSYPTDQQIKEFKQAVINKIYRDLQTD